MTLQPLLKLPFRLARTALRTARSVAGATSSEPVPTVPTPPPPAPKPAPPSQAPRPPIGVRVEQTPNPDARKFVCSVTVVPRGSLIFNDADNAEGTPFARELFAVQGVRTLFATKDFVTVTRDPEGPAWPALMPQIEDILRRTVGA